MQHSFKRCSEILYSFGPFLPAQSPYTLHHVLIYFVPLCVTIFLEYIRGLQLFLSVVQVLHIW